MQSSKAWIQHCFYTAIHLTEPLHEDLWPFYLYLSPLGLSEGPLWRFVLKASDGAEANRLDKDSREPLELILTLKTCARTQAHAPLICRQTHLNTWYLWLRACSLFISSPAVFFLSFLLFFFFKLTASGGAGRRITVRFLTAAFVFLYIYEVITQGNKARQSFLSAHARSAEWS